jgi:hypothetical protein
MADRETTLLAGRIRRIEQILGTPLPPLRQPAVSPLPKTERDFLREAGEDLYWNDLEWEKLTQEERLDQEVLTEMAFPGFLAFVRGLLLTEVMPDSPVPPRPAPEVVEDLLGFLAARVVELGEEASEGDGEERDQKAADLRMTSRLLDLSLCVLHDLGPEEVGKVEAAHSPE